MFHGRARHRYGCCTSHWCSCLKVWPGCKLSGSGRQQLGLSVIMCPAKENLVIFPATTLTRDLTMCQAVWLRIYVHYLIAPSKPLYGRILLFLIYKWRDWDWEKVNNLHKVTYLAKDGIRIDTYIVWQMSLRPDTVLPFLLSLWNFA